MGSPSHRMHGSPSGEWNSLTHTSAPNPPPPLANKQEPTFSDQKAAEEVGGKLSDLALECRRKRNAAAPAPEEADAVACGVWHEGVLEEAPSVKAK